MGFEKPFEGLLVTLGQEMLARQAFVPGWLRTCPSRAVAGQVRAP